MIEVTYGSYDRFCACLECSHALESRFTRGVCRRCGSNQLLEKVGRWKFEREIPSFFQEVVNLFSGTLPAETRAVEFKFPPPSLPDPKKT